MRALLRRANGGDDHAERLSYLDLTLDLASARARRGERTLELTRTEQRVLELLLRNPEQVLPRDMIYERVWGHDISATSNSLDVYVGYLRRKTEEGGEPRLIHTVRGVGFRLGDMSYRRRLMLSAALAVALAVALASVATYVFVRAQLRDSVDDGLRSLSERVGTAPRAARQPAAAPARPRAGAARVPAAAPLLAARRAGRLRAGRLERGQHPAAAGPAGAAGGRAARGGRRAGERGAVLLRLRAQRHATCACTWPSSPRARRCRPRARSRTSTRRCGGWRSCSRWSASPGSGSPRCSAASSAAAPCARSAA